MNEVHTAVFDAAAAADVSNVTSQVAEATEPTTSTLAAWPWVLLAQQQGMTMSEICEATVLTEGELRDPGRYLTQLQANRLAELGFRMLGPVAALRAAQSIDRGHFALAELVMRSAPTVRDGADRACEVFPLIHRYTSLTHLTCSDRSFLHLNIASGLDVHLGYVELTFAVTLQGVQRETGRDDVRFASTWFTHSGPSDTSEHERFFGPVRFGMPETRFEMSNALLELPLLRASESAHCRAREVANEALHDQDADSSVRRDDGGTRTQ